MQKYLDPKNDLAFKKIFGEEKHKEIPIAFLNAVFNLSGEDTITDLTFLNVIQPPAIRVRKESIVDVLVVDQKGSRYIVEMQVAKVPGFEKRAQFYAAKTYTSHFKVNDDYEDLQKVVFLAITAYVVFPDKENFKSNHCVLDTETFEHDLQDFSFTFIELPKFNKKLSELQTIEEKWYYFLKHADESRDIASVLAENPEILAAYKVLESTYWTESQLWEYEQIGLSNCDAISIYRGALKENKAKGRAEGLAEGRAEGKAEGQREAQIEVAKKLLQKGLALEEVSELTGVEMEDLMAMQTSSAK